MPDTPTNPSQGPGLNEPCPGCNEVTPTVEVTDNVRLCRRCLSRSKAVKL